MVDFIIDFTYRHCLNRQYQCRSKVNIGMSSTLHKSEGFQSENLDYAAGKTSGNVFLAKSIAFHTWKLAWKHINALPHSQRRIRDDKKYIYLPLFIET